MTDPDSRKAPEAQTGTCPRCDGRGSFAFDTCDTCAGAGVVQMGRPWSSDDDQRLRERPFAVTGNAIALRRPTLEVRARLRQLGLEMSDAPGLVLIRDQDGSPIDIDDPARSGGFA